MFNDESLILEKVNSGKGFPVDYKTKYSDNFYNNFIFTYKQNTKKRYFYRFMKRFFDIFVSFFALLFLLLPFAIIAIAIKCDSKGPVIFKNRRVGRYGKIFNCLKFRSMATSAPAEVATSVGGVDSYITKVGRFLRKTSLDELPQLWNVLIGQMSIIGYRPLVPTEENCNNMRMKLGVFEMKPGISGYAQVHGRDNVYYKNKALMDAFYAKNASIAMDFSLIWGSLMIVLKREGNDDDAKSVKNAKEARGELGSE